MSEAVIFEGDRLVLLSSWPFRSNRGFVPVVGDEFKVTSSDPRSTLAVLMSREGHRAVMNKDVIAEHFALKCRLSGKVVKPKRLMIFPEKIAAMSPEDRVVMQGLCLYLNDQPRALVLHGGAVLRPPLNNLRYLNNREVKL